MSMKDDLFSFHNQLISDDIAFLDMHYLHSKLLERLKKEAES